MKKLLLAIYISIVLTIFSVTPVSAAEMPKVKMQRADSKVVLTPILSYRLTFSAVPAVLKKFPFDGELNVDSIKEYLNNNKIKISCNEKVPTKIKNDCGVLKVYAYLLGEKIRAEQPKVENFGKVSLISYQANQLKGELSQYGVIGDYLMLVLPDRYEFILYSGINGNEFRRKENVGFPYIDKDSVYFYRDDSRLFLIDGKTISIAKGVDPDLFQENYTEHNYYGVSPFMNYYKDDKNLYFFVKNQFYKMAVSAASDFVLVDNNIYKDKNKVYFVDSLKKVWVLSGFDATSFYPASYYNGNPTFFDYADKSNLYFSKADYLYRIDLTRYKLVGLYLYPSIIKDNKEVLYFNKVQRTMSVLKGADAETYDVVDFAQGVLFSDKNSIYLRNTDLSVKKLSNIDRKTFEPDYNSEFTGDRNVIVFKDKNGSYALVEEGAVGSADGKIVLKKLPKPVAGTTLYRGYGITIKKDASKVYVLKNGERNVLAGANAATFAIIQDGVAVYGKDNKSIFVPSGCSNRTIIKLAGADSNTFEVVKTGNWDYFAKDNNEVWYYDKEKCQVTKIVGAVPDTFDFDNYLNQLNNL